LSIRVMRNSVLAALVIALLPINGLAADDPLVRILEGVREKYRDIPGFSVPYRREIITRSMALLGDDVKSDLATGQLHFKPPHYLKVQQESPRKEDVITDGDTIWWYIPQQKQVYRYPSDQLGQELGVLSDIFQGLKEVEASFHVTLQGKDEKGLQQLELHPDPPWSQVDHIKISVAEGDYAIRVVEIHNYVGGTTRFILANRMIQQAFDEDFFRFVVPEGVRVIEEEN
jgi:outer membrane lipoprotein-sorting protein